MTQIPSSADQAPRRVALATGAGLFLCPLSAIAQPVVVSPMGNVLCSVIIMVIYGNLGRGLATAAVVALGVGALVGKISWGLAITIAVGIGLVFGAPAITSVFLADTTGSGQIGCEYMP